MKKFVTNLKFIHAKIITISISLLISLLSLVLLLWLNYIDPSSVSMSLDFTLLLCTPLVLFIFIGSYTMIDLCIFDLSKRKAKEEIMKKYNLSKTEYTEIRYNRANTTESYVTFLLLVHSVYYFYAKLNDKEEIDLLVKNEKQEVMFNTTVSLQYFNKYFRQMEKEI